MERSQIIGGWDDFNELPRDEKQKAYELWAAAQPYESKAERRLRRNHMGSKWIFRHSQIRAAAKKRRKPVVKVQPPKELSARRQRQKERLEAQFGSGAFLVPKNVPITFDNEDTLAEDFKSYLENA